MDKILEQIDRYMITLEKEIMTIVDDQSISMIEKNRLMQPIVDQKKILLQTKKSLQDIKNKSYEAGCEMYKKVNHEL